MTELEQPAQLARVKLCRAVQPARCEFDRFFAVGAERATNPTPLLASDRTTPAANVPCYKAHCSFLI